jgi:RNA polymerase sigma factor (sigma-70 family)
MERDGKSRIFRFFDAERRRFISFVKRKMTDLSEMDAEDMVAEVMLAMLSHADPNGHVENLTAYVYRALNNKVTDFARKRRRTVSLQSFPDEGSDTSLLEYLADGSADVYSQAERKEFQRRLAEAVSSLEPKQRAVFVATEIKGRSFKELSVQWNEPVGTLLSRKCRAVKVLKEMLKDFKP